MKKNPKNLDLQLWFCHLLFESILHYRRQQATGFAVACQICNNRLSDLKLDNKLFYTKRIFIPTRCGIEHFVGLPSRTLLTIEREQNGAKRRRTMLKLSCKSNSL